MALIVAGYSLRGETAPGTPVKLTISIATDPSSMDGQDITGIADTIVRPQMYDRLVDFDENGRLVPQLATSWRVSQDGLTWTFTLRRGHKFWDGTPVNAEAVKR
ncbi:MAG: ABC transporter substrate-binding protein, partial [Armatimonadetes bacterium]|nr:ABC transporter substrate-binding protein [Armatimonadota bacterium]